MSTPPVRFKVEFAQQKPRFQAYVGARICYAQCLQKLEIIPPS